ncbi:hypothetical protein [Bradyrhizobium sp. Tv2a-2]|uniref:hypothetical protein n=1 Tax=Bradyrhizobium sp. Tv2a-2 TaxID=113395 RepID=UPI00046378E6|nr:hypothetical protein [Bradyrhizobium sp. Tv2a-2]
MTTTALPNPFMPTPDDLDEQIATARDMLNRAFWKAESAEQFAAVIQIEAEYLVPLLAQRASLEG